MFQIAKRDSEKGKRSAPKGHRCIGTFTRESNRYRPAIQAVTKHQKLHRAMWLNSKHIAAP
jgi:hypothetical protein